MDIMDIDNSFYGFEFLTQVVQVDVLRGGFHDQVITVFDNRVGGY